MKSVGRLVTFAVATFATIILASGAAAVTITEFPIHTQLGTGLNSIALGPDNNLWFTEFYASAIGRITPTGDLTVFALPTGGLLFGLGGITSGPDGNLWFTESRNSIGRITPAGVITEFWAAGSPAAISSGPDGNLWFTEALGSQIGRITPSGVITEFAIPTPDSLPQGITPGPDGNLWFAEFNVNKIGRITPAGVITEFTIPTAASYPRFIAPGSDGNVWFTEALGNRIGRITPAGVITEYPIPTQDSRPGGITSGPDDNLWFIETSGNQICRITPAGVISEFPLPFAGSFPFGIAPGPDGNLWFTEIYGNVIGRLTPGLLFFALSPCRALDTRNPAGALGGSGLGANELRSFPLVGACGIPADAVVVSANVTVVAPAEAGDFLVYAADQPAPPTTAISFAAGRTRANNLMVSLSLDGTQSIAIQNESAGAVNVVFDVNGYFR